MARYLAAQKHALRDIVFQVDADCTRIIKTKGLGNAEPGNAHELADVVAWGNSHDHHPPGSLGLDVAVKLKRYLHTKYG